MNLETMLNGLLADNEAKDDKRKANARDRYHAKRIASKLGIEITREHMSDGHGYWIEYHTSQVGPKGWSDQLFCLDWQDIREKLEAIEAGEKR